jgi:hypothetical protein
MYDNNLGTQDMKTRNAMALSLVLLATAGFVSNASAHGKTREQVRQELIQAENNGLRFVTNTSYPDVAPMYQQQVAQLRHVNNSGYGTETAGSAAAAKRVAPDSAPSECVGPISFCTPYFGS